jgi:hypothetical protein
LRTPALQLNVTLVADSKHSVSLCVSRAGTGCVRLWVHVTFVFLSLLRCNIALMSFHWQQPVHVPQMGAQASSDAAFLELWLHTCLCIHRYCICGVCSHESQL